MLGNQLDSMGCNHHSHKCTIIDKYGNIELEIEKMGGEIEILQSHVNESFHGITNVLKDKAFMIPIHPPSTLSIASGPCWLWIMIFLIQICYFSGVWIPTLDEELWGDSPPVL